MDINGMQLCMLTWSGFFTYKHALNQILDYHLETLVIPHISHHANLQLMYQCTASPSYCVY